MQIIPVIDLKDGQVVHAKQGQREQYQPIQSKLCPASDAFSVLDGFLSFYPFHVIYIADLNAIQLQGNNSRLIRQILQHYSEKKFWVDQGISNPVSNDINSSSKITVIGSESINDKTWSDYCRYRQPFVLSLDFSSKGQLGLEAVFDRNEFWPQDIIIMTLERVGSQHGPDIQLLKYYQTKYPEKNFIAAGGIRNTQDLQTLKDFGIKTALVASAIHQGTLDNQIIDSDL